MPNVIAKSIPGDVTSLGYEADGDVLIRTVGHAIPGFLAEDKLAARLHRAADEFACLLQPGADDAARAVNLEQELDRLEPPRTHEMFYRGASVGYATSTPSDTAETFRLGTRGCLAPVACAREVDRLTSSQTPEVGVGRR